MANQPSDWPYNNYYYVQKIGDISTAYNNGIYLVAPTVASTTTGSEGKIYAAPRAAR